MHKKPFFFAAALAVATGSLAAGILQNATFPAISQKGLKATFSNEAKFQLSGNEVDILGDAEQTVTDVAANGDVTIVENDTNTSVMVANKPVPAPSSQKTTYTVDKMGRLKAFSTGEAGQDQTGGRIFNLSAFLLPSKPVAPGESWTVKLPEDKKLGTVPITATYTFVKADKWKTFDVFEVKFTVNETGDGNTESSEGTMLIDQKSGLVDKMSAKVKNVVLSGVPVPLDGTISSVRKS